jgi:two-component system, cell cycle sensor histidine kinase and response regulator CckA
MGNLIGKVLVVDDEVELKNVLVQILNNQRYETVGFSKPTEGLAALKDQAFDVLLTDLMMPEMDGIQLLQAALEIDPHLVPIVMTGQGTIQTAVDAMRLGAFDYVLKPFRLQTILPVLTRAMNHRRLRLENLQLRETVAIYELNQTVAFSLDPQTVISKLADAALQQTDADEVSILLPTSDGQELYVAAVRGENRQRLLGERVPLQDSISSWVAREKAPLILDGVIEDERFRALWPRPDITSAISVPMQVANKLVGTINLNAVNRARPFTLGQMKALSILASTAAAALETSSLYTQVQRAEENYRSIFENAIDGIFQLAPDGSFIQANPAMAHMLGYSTANELLKSEKNSGEYLCVKPERFKEFCELLAENDKLNGFEIQLRRQDGSKVFLSESARAVRSDVGSILYYEGIAEDITERKLSQEALAAGEARRRAIFDSALDCIITMDHEGQVVDWNPAAEQAFGYSQEEVLTKDMASLIIPERYRDRHRKGLQDYLDTGQGPALGRRLEMAGLRADGNEFPLELAISRIEIADQPPLFTAYIRDLTDRQRLEEKLRVSEEQLRQSQKLEAIGQLAGGVAHDFNNLLTVIGGYSSILLGRMTGDNPQRSALEEIKKASDRASALTRQLLAFSRKQILQPKVLDLNEVVSDIEKMVRRLIGEDIDLLILADSSLGKTKADPGQVEQVLLNLIVNARDAMPQGGKLTIETSNVLLSDDYANRHGATSGSYVMLAVSDNGSGMAPEIKEHIFEPFFSTKPAGKGTGLGLSTVYGIIKQSGGHIWLYSEPEQGTTFKVFLPRVDDVAESRDSGSLSRTVPQGNETILLVEDEDQVRNILTDMLESQGYDLLVASNGPEALDIASSRNGTIHLMITDVVMPQMSGRELSELMANIRPEMRILYMSGYTDDAIVHHRLLDEGLNFIQKPFDTATVARKVRHVLDSAL